MAGVAFGQFGVDELGGVLGKEILCQTLFQLCREGAVTCQKPVLQHGGPDGEILRAEADAVLDGAAGMADLQPQIPQDVEHGFNHALRPCGDLVGGQEQQVDVGKRRHFTPAIAPHRKDRNPFAGGGRGDGVQHVHGGHERRRDQPIGQIGIRPGQFPRREGLQFKSLGNGAASGLIGVAQ